MRMCDSGRRVGREEFFYVLNDNYDEHAEIAIPRYLEMHHELADLILACWGGSHPLRLLDLGAGTGKTTAFVLSEYPQGTAVAVDLFEEMLEHARRRLADFGRRVTFVQGDFLEEDLGGGFDVCVSALAIHHQDPEGKRAVFRRVYDALAPGGLFLMLDWTKFSDPEMHERALRVASRHVRQRVRRADVVEAWIHHWRDLNIPDTVADMCHWLGEAGFAQADCVARYYGMALVYARKAGGRAGSVQADEP